MISLNNQQIIDNNSGSFTPIKKKVSINSQQQSDPSTAETASAMSNFSLEDSSNSNNYCQQPKQFAKKCEEVVSNQPCFLEFDNISISNFSSDQESNNNLYNINNDFSPFDKNFQNQNNNNNNNKVFSKNFMKTANSDSTNQYKDSQMIKMMESLVGNLQIDNNSSKKSNDNDDLQNLLHPQNSNSQNNFNMNKDRLFLQNPGKKVISKNSKKNKKKVDRFIPNRNASKLSIAFTSAHDLDDQSNDPDRLKGKDVNESQQVSVLEMYKSHVLGISNRKPCSTYIEEEEQQQQRSNQNILRFQDENSYYPGQHEIVQRGPPKNPLCSLEELIYNKNDIVTKYNPNKQCSRKISKIPSKVLDAPQLQDDFYLNLIDWSSQNQLAVALASCVYLWSATSNKVVKFCDLGANDLVTSVQWNPEGTHLAIGTSLGELQIWDSQKLQKIACLDGHTARVGSLAWSKHMLSSGSRDKTILQRDLRVNNSYISKLVGHKQEVCGMKWSFDGQQLATGGNDNKLLLWNLYSNNPIAKFNNHTAAVKALAWSPHQHSLLASGGGTADRTIRFWNTHTQEQINHVDTGSQVCNLLFAKNVNELVSTHGYSMNQICIWKYPTMEKVSDLYGHTSRVLFLAANPEGDTIVTGAGDETLRFWKLFPEQEEKRHVSSLLVGDMRQLR